MKTLILLCFWTFLLSSCKHTPESYKFLNRSVDMPSLEGPWELISIMGFDQSGRIHYPFDKNVKGFAMFDNNNKFSLQIYDATRPFLGNSDPFFCSDSEIRIAFLSEKSCFGSYTLRNDSVVFRIDAASFPNRSGKVEKRYFEMRGDTLLLIAPYQKLNGIFLTEHSIWKKLEDKEDKKARKFLKKLRSSL